MPVDPEKPASPPFVKDGKTLYRVNVYVDADETYLAWAAKPYEAEYAAKRAFERDADDGVRADATPVTCDELTIPMLEKFDDIESDDAGDLDIDELREWIADPDGKLARERDQRDFDATLLLFPDAKPRLLLSDDAEKGETDADDEA